MTRAVVVGSGPNGLAAAIRLAQRGLDVTVLERADVPGGGTRTSQATVPGLWHDDCSAVHPLGVLSPFFASLGLQRLGLRWEWPDIDLAHPLDDGRVGLLSRDLDRTVESLGVDGRSWRRTFAPLARDFDATLLDVLRPIQHVPRHPWALARFGAHAAWPATTYVRRWSDEPARALFTGSAAHAFARLDRPLSASVGVLLTTAGHRAGWPVARGGSHSIATALVAVLEGLGGRVLTGVEVEDLDRLPVPPPDLVMLDVTPAAALRLAGDRIAPPVRRALRRYRHGPAAFKVDFALDGPVPWTNLDVGRAGTVHLGGTADEIAHAEEQVVRGRMPERPFVLVSQPFVADPTRSAGGRFPLWAYAHVPHGWTEDVTETVIAQIERFAPGFRDRIVGVAARGPEQLEADNPNYVGGDIGAGANGGLQLLVRPRPARDPYRLAARLFLCSAATPPGAGVHGMCGVNAAESAIRGL